MKGQIDRDYGVRCIFCDGVFSGAGPSDDWGHNTVKCAAVSVPKLRERVDKLKEALRAVVNDVNDYERVNNLSPNPGRTECWDSVAHAKVVLQDAE